MLTSYNIVVHNYQANRKIHQLIANIQKSALHSLYLFYLFIFVSYMNRYECIHTSTLINACIRYFLFVISLLLFKYFIWMTLAVLLFLFVFSLQCICQFVPPSYCSCLNMNRSIHIDTHICMYVRSRYAFFHFCSHTVKYLNNGQSVSVIYNNNNNFENILF